MEATAGFRCCSIFGALGPPRLITGVGRDLMHRDSPIEAEGRHQEFLRSAISNRTMWALQNGRGWAQWSDENAEEPILPLWSEREPAAKCAEECFPEFHPVRVGLEILPPEYLPDLQKRGVWVGTNLTSEMTGIDTHVVNGLQEQLSFGLRE